MFALRWVLASTKAIYKHIQLQRPEESSDINRHYGRGSKCGPTFNILLSIDPVQAVYLLLKNSDFFKYIYYFQGFDFKDWI